MAAKDSSSLRRFPEGRCAKMDLPAALVVRDALGLGGSGLFTGEDQHNHGDHIGQHLVDVGGRLHALKGGQEGDGGAVRGHHLEQGEEEGAAKVLPAANV